MQSYEYGLAHILAAAEQISRHAVGEPVSDHSIQATLEQFYHLTLLR